MQKADMGKNLLSNHMVSLKCFHRNTGVKNLYFLFRKVPTLKRWRKFTYTLNVLFRQIKSFWSPKPKAKRNLLNDLIWQKNAPNILTSYIEGPTTIFPLFHISNNISYQYKNHDFHYFIKYAYKPKVFRLKNIKNNFILFIRFTLFSYIKSHLP